MKKSKFLKKSLAMLLAVMLVVAMIPLSASAATPNLLQVNAKADTAGSAVQLDVSGTTYTGTIPDTASSVVLQVLVADGNRVYYTDESTSTSTDKVANEPASGNKYWTIEIKDLKPYTEGDTVTVDFSVADENNTGSGRINAQAVLTMVPMDAETDILEFTVTSQAGTGGTLPQLGETVITKNTVEITVPYDASMTTPVYTIATLKLSDNAVAKIGGAAIGVGTKVANGATIKVENQGSVKEYTLKITPASGFTSFEIEEALDTIVFPDNIIAVMLPYGYTVENETFSVTPVFELDYPSAEASFGSDTLTSGDEITIGKAVYGYKGDGKDGTNVSLRFNAFGNTTATNDWADWKAVPANMESGNTFTSGNCPFVGYDVTVEYSENTSRTYTMYFYEPSLNNEAVIDEVTIGSETTTGSETASINQETKTIDITLPRGTNLSALNSKGTEISMIASNGADITVPMQSGVTFNDTTPPRAAKADYTTTGTLNASNSVKIKVVSEDKLTTEYYTLNVKAAEDFVVPTINTMTLKNADGTVELIGKLTNQGGHNVFVFEVPYYVYNADLLNGWKLYYTKSIGATAKYNGTTMPKSGAALNGSEAFLPEVGDGSLGTGIDLYVAGDELSANSATYYIQLNRATASEKSALTDFDLVGTLKYNEVTPDNTYKGIINPDQTIDIVVNWTDYANINDYGMVLDADKNTKVFALQPNGTLVSVVETEADNATGTGVYRFTYATGANAADVYEDSKIVVISEKAWVDMTAGGALVGNQIANWDTVKKQYNGLYTEYTMDITRDEPGKDADLTTLRLVDATGWELPVTIKQAGNTYYLDGDLPYALTSDTAKKNYNPVYLEYNISDGAIMMGVDTAITGNGPLTKTVNNYGDSYRSKVNYTLPTSSAIFEDIADYIDANGQYSYDFALDNYVASRAYLIIDRDGTVHIYKNGNEVTTVEDNKLAISSEDGLKYTSLEFRLNVEDANNEAAFTSFYFKEFPNFKGNIVSDNNGNTITVTLPYGTDLNKTEYTYLTPVYSTSEGAIVTVDDPELKGKPVYSGHTEINFTSDRKFTVVAENETTKAEYTVKVVVASRFSDVNEKDWFYNDVMTAAQLGYVNGMGDGTYQPSKTTTRAEFAKLLAAALGYDGSNDCDSVFPDIADDHWAKGAIAFCAERDIILGYEDGEFKANKTITRQEVAIMLQRAFNLNGSAGDLYPDDAKIAGWAKAEVYNVKHAGLMKGDADTGNFRPTSTLNRAEMATILMNAHRAGLIK